MVVEAIIKRSALYLEPLRAAAGGACLVIGG